MDNVLHVDTMRIKKHPQRILLNSDDLSATTSIYQARGMTLRFAQLKIELVSI